ncbi:hypothetical protein CHUAL_005452 [Chamberlinius hualienensis]
MGCCLSSDNVVTPIEVIPRKLDEGVKPFPVKKPTIIQSPKLIQLPVKNSHAKIVHNYNNTNGYKTALPNHTPLYDYLENYNSEEDCNIIKRGVLEQHDNQNYRQKYQNPGHDLSAIHSTNDSKGLTLVHGNNHPQLRNDSIGNAENEVFNELSLSNSAFNKLMNKKLEMVEEAERRKIDHRQKIEEKRNNWLKQQELSNNTEADFQNDQVPKTPPEKPTTVTKRVSSKNNLSSTHNGILLSGKKSGDSISRSQDPEEKLIRNQEEALKTAFANLENDDWNSKCSGIRIIKLLSSHNSEVLANNLHEVNLAVIKEVKNLRSSVSRSAIHCYEDLFLSMKKNMEGDLDIICKVLLHKSGESNVFIKDDVEKSLTQMVENVTPQRAAIALIAGGANHRNAAVRKTTAQFLVAACEKMGTNKIMCGTKDVTDKILLTASQFVMDGAPMTRYYGRKIFFMLLPHPEFDRTVRQYVPSNTVRNIQDILEGLKTKGIGSMPTDLSSSMSYRSLKGSFK